MSPDWIHDKLGLFNLRKDFQEVVDRGEIPLASAYDFSRVPYKFQPQFIDQARIMPVAEFRAMVQAFLKQFQESVRQGKLDAFYSEDFQAQPYMRPLKELLAERECSGAAALVLVTEKCGTPLAAWNAALAWVMHLDRESIEKQRQAVLKRNRNRKETPDMQP
jgi:hypothetical protein